MEKGASAATPAADRAVIRAVVAALGTPTRPSANCEHSQPVTFRPGEPLRLDLSSEKTAEGDLPVAILLHYRHVNQGETWQSAEMRGEAGRWRATIAGDYTKSPYPLAYYFELRDKQKRAWLFPGFVTDLCNQPYFVVRQG